MTNLSNPSLSLKNTQKHDFLVQEYYLNSENAFPVKYPKVISTGNLDHESGQERELAGTGDKRLYRERE